MKARNDVIGIEATIPAKKVDFLAIEDLRNYMKVIMVGVFP